MKLLAIISDGFLATKTFWWISIIGSSLIFTICDTLSKVWVDSGKWSIQSLVLLCVMAPLGYTLFGIVTQKSGLAVAAVLVNSFLVLGTTLMGLIVLKEWSRVSLPQYLGMAFAILGIILLLFPKDLAKNLFLK